MSQKKKNIFLMVFSYSSAFTVLVVQIDEELHFLWIFEVVLGV